MLRCLIGNSRPFVSTGLVGAVYNLTQSLTNFWSSNNSCPFSGEAAVKEIERLSNPKHQIRSVCGF